MSVCVLQVYIYRYICIYIPAYLRVVDAEACVLDGRDKSTGACGHKVWILLALGLYRERLCACVLMCVCARGCFREAYLNHDTKP